MRSLGSFWWHSQYGTLDPADIADPPVELNPYRKLWVRWAFADMKVVVLFGCGAAYGAICWIIYAVTGMWFLP